jgi:hypothetical protein
MKIHCSYFPLPLCCLRMYRDACPRYCFSFANLLVAFHCFCNCCFDGHHALIFSAVGCFFLYFYHSATHAYAATSLTAVKTCLILVHSTIHGARCLWIRTTYFLGIVFAAATATTVLNTLPLVPANQPPLRFLAESQMQQLGPIHFPFVCSCLHRWPPLF